MNTKKSSKTFPELYKLINERIVEDQEDLEENIHHYIESAIASGRNFLDKDLIDISGLSRKDLDVIIRGQSLACLEPNRENHQGDYYNDLDDMLDQCYSDLFYNKFGT